MEMYKAIIPLYILKLKRFVLVYNDTTKKDEPFHSILDTKGNCGIHDG
jgi:hypothetical protein